MALPARNTASTADPHWTQANRPADGAAETALIAPGGPPARRAIRRHLVVAAALSAVINVLLLSLPLYSLQVFSRAIPSANMDTLVMLTLIVVVALSLMALLDAVRTQI